MAGLDPSVREVAVLQEATRMILASADLDTILHQILLIVRNYFGVTCCSVFLLDESGQELYCRAHNGYDQVDSEKLRMKVGKEGIGGWVALTKAPLYASDVTQERRYVSWDPRVRSELGLPLIVREQVVGVLIVSSDQTDYFGDSILSLLTLFASQAAVALENARLYSTERRRMRQIELINLIARSATAADRLDEFLGTVADLIYDSFEGTEVAVLLRAEDGPYRLRAYAGAGPPSPEHIEAAARGGVLAEALAHHGNVLKEELAPHLAGSGCYVGLASELVIPLLSCGEILGAIVVAHERPRFFSGDDRAIAQASADVCATAIKNVQLSSELRRVTSTDFLTGIYNQRHFYMALADEIHRSKRYKKPFAAAMLDLRNFRLINATLGFDTGDQVLRQVSAELQKQLRENDVFCRFAGDRFALLFPETGKERLAAILTKLQDTLTSIRWTLPEGERSLSAAIASAHYPDDGDSEAQFVRLLLARVQQAKERSASAGSPAK